MRYVLAVSIAMVMVAAPITAGAQVGLKGGISIGNVSNGGLLPGEGSRRTGFAIGVSAFTPGALALGLEGFYAQRGVSDASGLFSRKLDYLDFPLLVRVTLPVPGIAPYAYAGPQISYEFACDAGVNGCPRDERPRWPTAGVIGAGVALGGDTKVSVEARYIYGLQDLRFQTVTASESFRDRSFMVLAGIAF